VQAVEAFVPPSFEVVEVARRVEEDGPAAPVIGMDPKRDLLRHGAGRHEHRGRFAEDRGNLVLELLDHSSFPVRVCRRV
jgi:hypothetical protein